ncbi:hypothetical protein CCP2SC5_300008 [Azospirillaceae bacterium]
MGVMIQREAMVLTFNDCLLVMSGVFGFALLCLPLVRKPRQISANAH